MKKLLLVLLTAMSLYSCTKDTQYTTPTNPNPITAKSNDDHGGEHDDEEICCSFRYGQWQPCSDGYQVRTWAASSKQCQPPIDSIQRRCNIGIVTYLYYNPQYTSLRIVCTTSGTVNIFNSIGQLTASLPYEANGRWVSVSFLPLGTYTATTFSRTTTFTR